ncbi:MAG: hypothetical protein K2X82_15605 [Gemmataceae bacterium]|nr:hypothetical protein [Gemmataceae bacterium]
MGRPAEFYTRVGDGEKAHQVGYAAVERYGYLRVRFVGPDGKRGEAATGCTKKDAAFHVEAAKIIAKSYAAFYPDPKRVSWDAALVEVEQAVKDLRPATLTAYKKVVRVFRETVPALPNSPVEISGDHAAKFSRLFLSGTYKRGKKGQERRRSPITLASHIRNLSALWRHLADLALVKSNPWKLVRKPEVPKKRKAVPTEDAVEHFFGWVHARYPGWNRLFALLELKAMSGCRSLDLVLLRSDQLVNGRVVWEPDQTKHKEGRAVLVPAELFKTLQSVAGPTYLWEGITEDLRTYRPSKNQPSHFKPATVYWLLGNIFREYADAHPDRPRLSPHALRRRAITVTTQATQSVDATATAIGINPATARAYYLDSRRAFDADTVFSRVADTLIPKRTPATLPPHNPGTEGHPEEQRGTPDGTK